MGKVEEYILFLEGKGFQFHEDTIGFIFFGKHYTNASEELITTAIELTIKAQVGFDGSFYVSLLETFLSNNIQTRKDAYHFVKEKKLLVL